MFNWFKSKPLPSAEELRANSAKYKELAEKERLRCIAEAVSRQNRLVDFEIKRAYKAGADKVRVEFWLHREVKERLISLGYSIDQQYSTTTIIWDRKNV